MCETHGVDLHDSKNKVLAAFRDRLIEHQMMENNPSTVKKSRKRSLSLDDSDSVGSDSTQDRWVELIIIMSLSCLVEFGMHG
jgi:hypothetical protein